MHHCDSQCSRLKQEMAESTVPKEPEVVQDGAEDANEEVRACSNGLAPSK